MNSSIAHATQFLQWLHDGEPFEVCVISPKNLSSRLWEGRANGKGIIAGWFVNAETAAKLACQVESKGVYVTLNPTNDALLSRAESRLKAGVNRTADRDIARIKNLLIDLDPVRPADVSSTTQEHDAALEMAQIIKTDLTKEGWPEGWLGDSGNGGHLGYPVDLPNTPDSIDLVKRVLKGLSLRYQEHLGRLNLELDQAVFNPARLTKLYGTWVRKGDNTKTRPHRLSQIISLPATRHPVPLELLQKLAATVQPQDNSGKPSGPGTMAGQFDVGTYLAHYGVEVVMVKPHLGGKLFCLQECLFDSAHAGKEAAIGQAADGKLFYQCFHNSCKGRTWAEARVVISGPDKLGRFIIGGACQPAPTRPGSHDHDQQALAAGAAESRVYEQKFSSKNILSTDVDNALRSAGWTEDRISQVVNILLQSEKSKGISNIAAEVREWALSTTGDFLSTDVDRELQLSTLSTSPQEKKVILGTMSKALERLVKDGVLERVGTRRGHFRRIERECEALDFLNASPHILPIKWPFQLEKLVNIYRKNLVVIAGASNAGKTAFLLNVARMNMDTFPVHYFSSEMGPEELRLRLENFDLPLEEWKFRPYERAANFADAIRPEALNVVDFLELTDNFYKVAGELKAIFDKLTTGVAVVAIQKDAGKDLGRGGGFSLEKARLYLSMNSGEIKIIKGKNWAQKGRNPNNILIKFKLVNGARFIETPEVE